MCLKKFPNQVAVKILFLELPKGTIVVRADRVFKISPSPSVKNAPILLPQGKGQDMSLVTVSGDNFCPKPGCLGCDRTMF